MLKRTSVGVCPDPSNTGSRESVEAACIVNRLFVIAALVGTVGCSGSSTSPSPTPPAPIAAAQLMLANGTTVSANCDARRATALLFGLGMVDNCHVTGALTNMGQGCAGSIHGTITITETGTTIAWIPSVTIAHPGETFTYTGGPVSLPTAPYHYTVTPQWTNVACQ